MQPIHAYYKQFKDYEVVQYVGIAIDEPKRLARLSKKGNIDKVSLLQKYGYTEEMAREKCLEYGLLSPIYGGGGIETVVGSAHQSALRISQSSNSRILTYGMNS